MAVRNKRIRKSDTRSKKSRLNKSNNGLGNKKFLYLWANVPSFIFAVIFWLITTCISIFISYKIGLTKKDLNSAVSAQASDFKSAVQQVKDTFSLEVAGLKGNILTGNQYNEYLRVYGYLYKNVLEKIFPGGYQTFGATNDNIVNPGIFKNSKIIFNIEGKIKIINSGIDYSIKVNEILNKDENYWLHDTNIGNTYPFFRIGQPFVAGGIHIADWDIFLMVLNADSENPVFVIGLGHRYSKFDKRMNDLINAERLKKPST